MAVLEGLEPRGVLHWFEELCRIPHGSGNTQALSDYLVQFGRERGLAVQQDALGNVILCKPGTPGYENAPAVMLQGHMDMVCEMAPGCTKDMAREGLDLVVDGDVIYAEGTTLGADDGIAVAMGLALLDSHDIPHPPLEVVLTVDEEVGMKGATGIDLSGLKSRLLLNLDSETEGEITAGCAGAARVDIAVPVKRDTFPGETVEITVSGLLGGHSGAAIDRGRANAMVLLGRILYAFLQENDGRLVTLSGGGKDNAIPVSASAVLTVADAEKTTVICQKMEKIFRREFAVADSDITVAVAPCRSDVLPMDADSTHRVLALLQCAPNGVLERSREVEGLVQTSLNLGILATEADSVVATFCVRSNMNTQKEMLLQKLELLCDLLGGKMSVSGSYPAWEFREDSPLRALIVEVFTEQYGHAPKIEVLHGGVECGMLADKLPGLDAVAMGPEVSQIHTPRERMYISSVQRTWNLIVETLRRLR